MACMILGALLVSTLTAAFGRTIDISPEEQKVLLRGGVYKNVIYLLIPWHT